MGRQTHRKTSDKGKVTPKDSSEKVSEGRTSETLNKSDKVVTPKNSKNKDGQVTPSSSDLSSKKSSKRQKFTMEREDLDLQSDSSRNNNAISTEYGETSEEARADLERRKAAESLNVQIREEELGGQTKQSDEFVSLLVEETEDDLDISVSTKKRGRPKSTEKGNSPKCKKGKGSTVVDQTQPGSSNDEMMKRIMEELREVKQQLQSKFASQHVVVKEKECRGRPSREIVKSPPTSTIYTPVVAKAHTEPNRGVVQHILNSKGEFTINGCETDSQINEYLTNIRLGAQQAREEAVVDSKRKNKDPVEDSRQVRRRLDFDRSEEVEEPQETEVSMREKARDRILEAEKYREQIEKPKGRVIQNDIITQLVDQMGATKVDQPVQMEFPGNPVLDDNQFMHITCHVDDKDAELARRGQYLDFDKLLAKYNRSFNQEEVQRIEVLNKDGQAFFLPREEKQTKITNVHLWEKAFRIYMALYAKEHPRKVPEMIQYMSTIQLAASKYTWDNVAYYDNVFRHWMAKNPNRSWGKTFTEMWNITLCDHLSVARLQSGSQYGGKVNQKKDNKGVCWRFNKGICNSPVCCFAHRCTYCGGTSHGAHVCFKKNRKSSTSGSGNNGNNNNGGGGSGVTDKNKKSSGEGQADVQPKQ